MALREGLSLFSGLIGEIALIPFKEILHLSGKSQGIVSGMDQL